MRLMGSIDMFRKSRKHNSHTYDRFEGAIKKIARLRPAAIAIANFCTLYDTYSHTLICMHYFTLITLHSLQYINYIAFITLHSLHCIQYNALITLYQF